MTHPGGDHQIPDMDKVTVSIPPDNDIQHLTLGVKDVTGIQHDRSISFTEATGGDFGIE